MALPPPSAPPPVEAEFAAMPLIPPLPPPTAALASALRHPPAAEECELQNESYVSIVVVFCVPVPGGCVPGPGAVGMSNVLGGRKDERDTVG